MPEKYQTKYRIKSHRLSGWDYSADALYFITIVSFGRVCVFGDVIDGRMVMSEFGIIAHDMWYKSFEIRQELFLDEFILMPNHIHAIVKINGGGNDGTGCRDARPCVSTTNVTNDTDTIDSTTDFKRRPKSISSFVAGYKSAVVTQIDNYIDEHSVNTPKYNRKNRLWQSNYHDHIIRNKKSYCTIKQYIKNNPSKWFNDKFHL